jgi:ureidoglycolate hydrolase
MSASTVTTIPAQPLDATSFAPYGEVIYPRSAGSQFDINPYDPETSTEEPRLTLTNGTPRLWIMRLRKNGLVFSKLARHRRVSQCLGSLQGKEWFIAVVPPNNPADGAKPEPARMAAFRIPGDRVIKLNVATWHAGPHFTHDECLFFNLENLDTNKRDFEDYEMPNEVRISP